jgi:dTDP-4-dehydrorhamnose 3,5-epimerase
MLRGATKDTQSATTEGLMIRDPIAGVEIRTTKNLITRSGVTTEAFRTAWGAGPGRIEHMIHVSLRPHAISAWHCHLVQTDHVFVTDGTLRLALYDDREQSATRGKLNVLLLSRLDPRLVVIPPGVWHGLQNVEGSASGFVNFFDHAYCYEDPDEWRLPWDTAEIPYRFPV